MEGGLRRHDHHRRTGVPAREGVDHLGQRRVGEHVGVVGEEHLVAVQVVPHPAQPLPDRRLDAGLSERDRPVGYVGGQQLGPPAPQHEVVGRRLLVVEEEVLDVMRPVAQAQDELLVPEVRVVAHHVPDQRPRAHHRHRLGHVVEGALAHPHPVTAAEQYDLHAVTFRDGPSTTLSSGTGKTSRPPHSCTKASCSTSSARRFHGRTRT